MLLFCSFRIQNHKKKRIKKMKVLTNSTSVHWKFEISVGENITYFEDFEPYNIEIHHVNIWYGSFKKRFLDFLENLLKNTRGANGIGK